MVRFRPGGVSRGEECWAFSFSCFFFPFGCAWSSLTGLKCPQNPVWLVCCLRAHRCSLLSVWAVPSEWCPCCELRRTMNYWWPAGSQSLVAMKAACSVQQFCSPDLDKLGASKTHSCLFIQEVGERWLRNASIFSPFVESQKDDSERCFFINNWLSYLCAFVW